MGLDRKPSATSSRANAPRVVRTKKSMPSIPQGMHVNRGYPHLHHKKGSCLCLDSCCYSSELGCVCRSCSGVGHTACVDINIRRAKARIARAKQEAKQRANSSGDK